MRGSSGGTTSRSVRLRQEWALAVPRRFPLGESGLCCPSLITSQIHLFLFRSCSDRIPWSPWSPGELQQLRVPNFWGFTVFLYSSGLLQYRLPATDPQKWKSEAHGTPAGLARPKQSQFDYLRTVAAILRLGPVALVIKFILFFSPLLIWGLRTLMAQGDIVPLAMR